MSRIAVIGAAASYAMMIFGCGGGGSGTAEYDASIAGDGSTAAAEVTVGDGPAPAGPDAADASNDGAPRSGDAPGDGGDAPFLVSACPGLPSGPVPARPLAISAEVVADRLSRLLFGKAATPELIQEAKNRNLMTSAD